MRTVSPPWSGRRAPPAAPGAAPEPDTQAMPRASAPSPAPTRARSAGARRGRAIAAALATHGVAEGGVQAVEGLVDLAVAVGRRHEGGLERRRREVDPALQRGVEEAPEERRVGLLRVV